MHTAKKYLSVLEEPALRNYTQSGLRNNQIVSAIRIAPHVTFHRPIIFGLLHSAPPWLLNVMPSKSRFRQTAAPKHPLYALQRRSTVRQPRKSTFAAPEMALCALREGARVRQFGGNASRKGTERKAASMSKTGPQRSRNRSRAPSVSNIGPLCSRTARETALVSKSGLQRSRACRQGEWKVVRRGRWCGGGFRLSAKAEREGRRGPAAG